MHCLPLLWPVIKASCSLVLVNLGRRNRAESIDTAVIRNGLTAGHRTKAIPCPRWQRTRIDCMSVRLNIVSEDRRCQNPKTRNLAVASFGTIQVAGNPAADYPVRKQSA